MWTTMWPVPGSAAEHQGFHRGCKILTLKVSTFCDVIKVVACLF